MIDTAAAKAWLKVETNVDDALIAALVLTAIAHVEAVTGKFLSVKAFTQELARFPDSAPYAVKLMRGPVVTVSEIAYDPTDGAAEATIADFRLVEGNGRTSNGSLQPAYGETWPSTLDGLGTVRISGTAGYADSASEAPELDQACLMLVAHWYANREAVAGGALSEIPLGVQALIGPYRPVGLA